MSMYLIYNIHNIAARLGNQSKTFRNCDRLHYNKYYSKRCEDISF